MNTSWTRRGRRALARPASRCDTAEAGGVGGGGGGSIGNVRV